MDDVWSREAWDAVKTFFPDYGNGSRVLLTTRLAEVANHTSSNNDFSHQMQLLDQSESWNLFREKAYRSHDAEFETIWRPIVEKCKGLRLAIVVVAGLFSKLNTLYEWKNISHALNSFVTTTLDEECSKVLFLSYNHLPHYLKACFLYLGVFPEDKEIESCELRRLWFAEGFVKAFEDESFNAVAKRYIQELLDRNLIILSELSKCGRRVKRFRMHDLLHAFCVREAQNENLLHVLYENGSNFPKTCSRWISIQSVEYDTSTLLSCSKNCRSFFCFHKGNTSLNFNSCNLLRVVYVNYAGMYEKIVDHVHLRSLNLFYVFNNSVEITCRAWNLQTLDICDYSGDVGGNYSEFPQLRHIDCGSFFGIPPKVVHELCVLRADYCTKECITNIPYLEKAYIRGKSKDWNDCIKNIACLEHLKTLCIYGDGVPTSISNHIVLLKNLMKLSFLSMGYEWKDINVLSNLPMLKVLKLNDYVDYGGKEEYWELTDKENFCQLILLEISYSSIQLWEASSHHFPKLEHLLLHYCDQLTEIPIGFGEISMLKSIELIACLGSAVESAKQIQNEQFEYGNYNMVVIEENTQESDVYEELEEQTTN